MSGLRVETRCLRCFRLIPSVFDDETVPGTLIVQSTVCKDCAKFHSSSLSKREELMKAVWERK